MVQEGLGISVVARWVVQPYLKSWNLKAVRISKRGLYREWWAVVRNNGKTPAYIHDFVGLIASKTPAMLGQSA